MTLFDRSGIMALDRAKRPFTIPTAVTPLESTPLFELAQASGTVLEIGALWGYSTILFAIAGAMVYSIDPHRDLDTWEGFRRNIEEFHMGERITALREFDYEALPRLIRQAVRFDLAFVDGDHSREACAYDIRACRQLVRPGGWIACHDYVDTWPGVIEACRETLSDITERRLVGSLLLAHLPAER